MARFGLVLCAVCLTCPTLRACSVPVFRYALERWPAARYDLLIFHRGPLSSSDRDAVRRIESDAARANVTVRPVELDAKIDGDLRAVWDREGKAAEVPRLVLRYPDSGPQIPSLWSGPLSAASIPPLIDSPARRAMFDRLTAGHAGAVLLLLSGNATADAAARAMLARELPRIAGQIELPPRTEEGPQVQSVIPLRVSFPLVEVARTAEEDALVRILLGSEDGLAETRGPIAFPVFGRGRALCSLHGRDLEKPDELRRSLEFLCRACSCQVKELNPGVDLLVAGNWELILDAEVGPPPRFVSSAPLPAETRPDTGGPERSKPRSPPPPGYQAVEVVTGEEAPRRRSPWLRFGTAAAVGLVLATGVWALRSRRTPPNPEP
jgi:hypothetical protein